MSFIVSLHITIVVDGQRTGLDLIVLQFDGNKLVPLRRVDLGIIDSVEVKHSTAGLAGQGSMQDNLGMGQQAQVLNAAHQFVRVEGVQSGYEYFFNFFQGIQSDVKHLFCFEFTAEILQDAANTGMQFFPVNALVAVYRGVDAGFFQSNLVLGDGSPVDTGGIGGGFTAGIASGRGSPAVVTGGEHRFTGDVQTVEA